MAQALVPVDEPDVGAYEPSIVMRGQYRADTTIKTITHSVDSKKDRTRVARCNVGWRATRSRKRCNLI